MADAWRELEMYLRETESAHERRLARIVGVLLEEAER
jgi:hypothetical protein